MIISLCKMDVKFVYAFRGLIAFVAFSDFGIAVRAFVENKCIFNEFAKDDTSPLSRIYGMLAALKALILIHCTLFIHYKPLLSMGICSLIMSSIMYLMESLVYHTARFNFHVTFPCILDGITAVGLFFTLMSDRRKPYDNFDENAELLRKAKIFKRKTWLEKNY